MRAVVATTLTAWAIAGAARAVADLAVDAPLSHGFHRLALDTVWVAFFAPAVAAVLGAAAVAGLAAHAALGRRAGIAASSGIFWALLAVFEITERTSYRDTITQQWTVSAEHAVPADAIAASTAALAVAPECGCTFAYAAPNSDFARAIARFSATSTNSQPP